MSDQLVKIGEVIVNGIVFDPKNGERLRTMDPNTLLKSIRQLFELLDERGVDYVLAGGIAMLVYADGRNTQDIDLYQNDVLRLLREFDVATDPLFAELARHMLPGDVEELRKIVIKIKTEIAESRRRFSDDH